MGAAKISSALSVEKVVSYYVQDHSAAASRSYYTRGGEAGEWMGHEARAFGLIGKPVELETLTRLARGEDPNTGVQLIGWRGVAVEPESAWQTEPVAWKKHLERVLGVRAAVEARQAVADPARRLPPSLAWDASQIPIGQLWRDLGGPELKPGNQKAFWRGGDALAISIDTKRGVWHDFVTGDGGGTIKLAATVLGVSPSDAVKYLREQYKQGEYIPVVPRIEPDAPTPVLDLQREEILKEMHAIARDVFAENLLGDGGKAARGYLSERGIKPGTVREFRLGLADTSGRQLVDKLNHYGRDLMRESGLFVERDGEFRDRFRGRLMFPIEDVDGRVVAFAGRKPPNDLGPKYVNSPETAIYHKGELLYNLARAKERGQETGKLILVEGYLDVIAAYQAGARNVVAQAGTALTEKQAALLRENAVGVVMHMDPDAAGLESARRSIPKLLDAGVEVQGLEMSADAAAWIKEHGGKEYRQSAKRGDSLVKTLERLSRDKFGTPFGPEDKESFEKRRQWILSVLEHVPAEQRAGVEHGIRKLWGTPEPAKPGPEVKEHRAAWDMTLGAPKTVSLTGLVGKDERVVTVHERAARAALTYLERAIQVKMGGFNRPETTSRMVAAVFQHDTARPVDGYAAPHLHTHCVIFNMSMDSEGQYRALNPQELFYLQAAVDAVYQNELAVGLKALGYELEYGKNLAIEIKGYTEEYREAESPRTTEIEAEKERLRQFGPAANQMIALRTRSAKLDIPREEIRASHAERAAKFGNQPEKVVASAREAVTYSPDHRAALADDAIAFAKASLSERTTVMEDHEIHRDALRFGRGYITLPDVEAAFQRHRHEFVEVIHWRQSAHDRRWTTPELIAKERYILDWMAAGRGAVRPIAGGITEEEFRERFRGRLGGDQSRLVWDLIHSEGRMVGVQGFAGTGKTTALGVLREFVERYGFEARGVAATTKAVGEMNDVGLRSETLAGFVHSRGTAAKRPRAYFADEASLVDVHMFAAFLAKLNPADRVFVIGDKKQHQSIGAGQVFAELQAAGMETYKLRYLMRQRPKDYREVVLKIGADKIVEAIQALDEQGRIVSFPNETERFRAIAQDAIQNVKEKLVVSPDNRSRGLISEEIRRALQEKGSLGRDVYCSRILNQRADVTETKMKFAPTYRPGDVVHYRRKVNLGIRSGDYASVMEVNRDANTVTVMRESDGRVFTYDPRRIATAAELYEPTQRQFAVGDRIQFTRQWKEYRPGARGKLGHVVTHASNGAMGTIEKLDAAGNISVLMDKGEKRLSWNLEQMPHIDYGYVMTSFRSQGGTAEEVIVHIDTDAPNAQKLLNRQLLYVATTRGRQDVRLYVNDRGELDRYLTRMAENATALAPAQVAQYKPTKGVGITV